MSDNIWKKMKFFVMGDDDQYDDEYEEEFVEEEVVVSNVEEDDEDRNIITDAYVRPRANLVDIKSTGNGNQLKVIVYKPTQYSDAEQIVKNLKLRKPVVVNLEEVEVELARKIFNFCSGAICALDGEMRKISKEIFILAPNNVTLDAEKSQESADADKTFDWRR